MTEYKPLKLLAVVEHVRPVYLVIRVTQVILAVLSVHVIHLYEYSWLVCANCLDTHLAGLADRLLTVRACREIPAK